MITIPSSCEASSETANNVHCYLPPSLRVRLNSIGRGLVKRSICLSWRTSCIFVECFSFHEMPPDMFDLRRTWIFNCRCNRVNLKNLKIFFCLLRVRYTNITKWYDTLFHNSVRRQRSWVSALPLEHFSFNLKKKNSKIFIFVSRLYWN